MKTTELHKDQTEKFGDLTTGEFFLHPTAGLCQKLASAYQNYNTLLLPEGKFVDTDASTMCVLIEITEIIYRRP